MPPYSKESHFVKYARSNSSDCATHSIQDQISQKFSMVICNDFIGEEATFDENSVSGYKMMGFQKISKDEEPKLFYLRLEVPIPFSVFEDSYSWVKYGHHILPLILSISSREKHNSMILFGNAS